MPTYTYRCKDCTYQYDAMQSMKAAPHAHCPKCSGSVARLIGSGAGILFKGSGFYVTDYRKSKNNSNDNAKSNTSQKSDTNSSSANKTTTASAKPKDSASKA